MIQSIDGVLYALAELMKTNWPVRSRKRRRSRSMSSGVKAIQSTTTSNRWPASALGRGFVTQVGDESGCAAGPLRIITAIQQGQLQTALHRQASAGGADQPGATDEQDFMLGLLWWVLAAQLPRIVEDRPVRKRSSSIAVVCGGRVRLASFAAAPRPGAPRSAGSESLRVSPPARLPRWMRPSGTTRRSLVPGRARRACPGAAVRGPESRR